MSNEKNNTRNAWIPVIIALSIILGVFIGTFLSQFVGNTQIFYGNSKIDKVIRLIKSNYVDSIETDEIIENTLPSIFKELDPHSSYIPAKDLQLVNDDLEESFSGIGIQFNMATDTITVISVISGGPSEKMGLMPGDRIITVDDSLFVGLSTERVMRTLRGKKGTPVKVGIHRTSCDTLIPITIIRGDVPNNSVDATYKLNDETGYIKINKFGRSTYNEFLLALITLKTQGCSAFVIDLRANSGGYMDAAIAMLNELLPADQMIVYTEGRAFPRTEARANGMGSYPTAPIVVLVDEWSASAAEIFAGAIQDNDRGAIVGRRTFGKGLVQNQFALPDSSAIRLTIARYYIPSGRSIQKPYEMGHADNYEMDIIKRYEHGEFVNKDSIKQNTDMQYLTIGGRTVYGGGGVMPDYFIPRDTTGYNAYYTQLINQNIIYQYAFTFTDENRQELSRYTSASELAKVLARYPLVNGVSSLAWEKSKIRRRPIMIAQSHKLIQQQTIALITRNMLGENAFYEIYNQGDPVVEKAIELIKERTPLPNAK